MVPRPVTGDHGLKEFGWSSWGVWIPTALKNGEVVELLTGDAIGGTETESLVCSCGIVDPCVLYGDVTEALPC